jgi:hypothetical protein
LQFIYYNFTITLVTEPPLSLNTFSSLFSKILILFTIWVNESLQSFLSLYMRLVLCYFVQHLNITYIYLFSFWTKSGYVLYFILFYTRLSILWLNHNNNKKRRHSVYHKNTSLSTKQTIIALNNKMRIYFKK